MTPYLQLAFEIDRHPQERWPDLIAALPADAREPVRRYLEACGNVRPQPWQMVGWFPR